MATKQEHVLQTPVFIQHMLRLARLIPPVADQVLSSTKQLPNA